MIYTEGVTVFLGLSLLFYLILGGADFGAGILELLIGDRGINTVQRAIAPVWEANHMWLIIAVVILFNGFPETYALVSTALHIPIMMVLVGIILRGTAFTFRHYDAKIDGSQILYSQVFRWSSAFTVFSLGLVIAPLISGSISTEIPSGFYDFYIAPWLNGFSIFTGLFLMTLSTYISAIYLLGEVRSEWGYNSIVRAVKGLLIASILSGLGLFLFSYWDENEFHSRFLAQAWSLAALIVATAAVPLIFRLIKRKAIWSMRIAVAFQMTLILVGMLLIQFPYLAIFKDGSTMSIYTHAAPTSTMKLLFWALMIGVLIIFPALIYLIKIFKSN